MLLLCILLELLFSFGIAAQAKGFLLKQGMQGEQVKQVQISLNKLGYFSANTTGYFGEITKSALERFQKDNGLKADGIVGKGTWGKLSDIAKTARTGRGDMALASRSSDQRGQSLVPWNTAKNIFSIGKVATVIDIGTGIKFNVKRTYGYNHADTETLTIEDTQAMKGAVGRSWNWNRRPIILVVDGRWLAASMSGMPHAGVDSQPANVIVSGRSDDYGSGENLDAVKGNGMDGHFDIHFLYSRTHGTDKIDPAHQEAVKKAAAYIVGQ